MKVELEAGTPVIILPERCDMLQAKDLHASARQRLENGARNLIVEMGGTVLIDSSCIGVLVSIAKEARSRSATLSLRNLSSDITELFADTGLDKIFSIIAGGQTQKPVVDLFENSADIKLDIIEEMNSGVAVLHCSGVMNHPQGSQFFKQRFLLAMADYKKILIDLNDLTFFDSLSVSVMLSMNKLLRETTGTMRVCGANFLVNDLFHTLSIDQIISLHPTVDEALATWN
jgi:anti-anti-sigma factor